MGEVNLFGGNSDMGLEEIKKSITQKPFFETENGLLYCADCLDIMKQMPDECVDLVVIDPPYNVGKGFEGEDLKEEKYYEMLESVFGDCCRIMVQPSGSLITHIPIFKIFEFGGLLNGKINFNRLLFFHQPNSMSQSNLGFIKTEILGWYGNGKVYHRYGDTITVGRVAYQKHLHLHPTEKPERLYFCVVRMFSGENTLILDPFLGSGTTCVAAQRLKRKWIGIEINEEYCRIAQKRIEGEIEKQRQQELSL